MNNGFADEIKKIVTEDRLFFNEPMKLHTTFRIGGSADFFVKPESEDEIKALIECAGKYNTAYYILGGGSNLLVNDEGYRGLIIQLGEFRGFKRACGI